MDANVKTTIFTVLATAPITAVCIGVVGYFFNKLRDTDKHVSEEDLERHVKNEHDRCVACHGAMVDKVETLDEAQGKRLEMVNANLGKRIDETNGSLKRVHDKVDCMDRKVAVVMTKMDGLEGNMEGMAGQLEEVKKMIERGFNGDDRKAAEG